MEPVPKKSKFPPPLYPKQKINRSESDLRRINSVLRKTRPKLIDKSPSLEDYEDLPPSQSQNIMSDIYEDYDEPIPHNSKSNDRKQYVNIIFKE